MTVTIAHISDLHFGARGQEETWNTLVQHFRDDPPDLFLVTGDIVDTPNVDLLKKAKAGLDQLHAKHRQKYLVCPGNHDRHFCGNAIGHLKSLWWRDASIWFAQIFQNNLAVLERGELLLGVAPNTWNVRIRGIDTSFEAKYAAQGFVSAGDLQRLKQLGSDGEEVDATILLAHHHFLPIAASEANGQRLTGLFDATTVKNAGSVLGAIVSSNINLVLHGHEHLRNIAKFGTLGQWGGETVILGAGSATGMVTMKGSQPQSASSNLIELRDDQSIWVKEVVNRDGQWRVDQEAVCLSSARRTRQHAYVRRQANGRSRPVSAATKTVLFTHQRDVTVHLTYTDWRFNGEFVLDVRSQTGTPMEPRVDLDLADGAPQTQVSERGFVQVEGRPGLYSFRHPIAQHALVVPRARVSYRWLSGALLCKEDLGVVKPADRDFFRARGKEFISFEVFSNLRQFRLSARLPEHFEPQDVAGIEVYYEAIDSHGDPEPAPELKGQIDCDSSGVISLKVEYPWTGWRYYLVWPLPTVDIDATSTEELRAMIAEQPAEALDAFFASLEHEPWSDSVSAVLYLPEQDMQDRVALRSHARKAGEFAIGGQADRVILDVQDQEFIQAWWGSVGVLLSSAGSGRPDVDAIRDGMLDGERWTFIMPVRDLAAKEGFAPAALIRVGISTQVDQLGLNGPGSVQEFTMALRHAVIALLHELRS